MAKTKVFVSFDFDNDLDLKTLMVGQAILPDSPFEISDYSLKEAKPEADWLAHARTAIARSDVFMIVLGSKTRSAPGVLKELAIANAKGKKRFQIIGRPNGGAHWAVQGGGNTYKWTWENLKKLLA